MNFTHLDLKIRIMKTDHNISLYIIYLNEGGGEIEWKQKNKSEYGTCDKNILTIHHPSIKICTLFDETKKGIFLPPSLLYVPISPSGHLFGRHCMKYFLSKLSRSKARPIKQNIADIVDK